MELWIIVSSKKSGDGIWQGGTAFQSWPPKVSSTLLKYLIPTTPLPLRETPWCLYYWRSAYAARAYGMYHKFKAPCFDLAWEEKTLESIFRDDCCLGGSAAGSISGDDGPSAGASSAG